MLTVLGLAAALASAMPTAQVPAGPSPGIKFNRDYNSNNWCGMVKKNSASAVEARWMNPSASPIYNGDYYEAYQWVGIDGASTNCNRILQAGTGQYVSHIHVPLRSCVAKPQNRSGPTEPK